MKKTVKDITRVVLTHAKSVEMDAGMSGAHHDGGASRIRAELDFFIMGINAVLVEFEELNVNENMPFTVPSKWEKFFLKEDPEYKEFLRLQEKFKSVR